MSYVCAWHALRNVAHVSVTSATTMTMPLSLSLGSFLPQVRQAKKTEALLEEMQKLKGQLALMRALPDVNVQVTQPAFTLGETLPWTELTGECIPTACNNGQGRLCQ